MKGSVKRVILGVTGIRSDYDIMSSVFKAIAAQPQLELKIVATGAHLSEAFGRTVEDIRSDGFVVEEEVENLLTGDQASSRVKGLAIQLQGLVQTVARLRPDILLVLGDREEAMTTALVGAYQNIPVAHIAGGDRVIGNVDDQVRHAVTKLANLHFVTNQASAERVLRLGEQPFRVHQVGHPGLDRYVLEPRMTCAQLSSRLKFALAEGEKFILLIQHAISTEIQGAFWQMKTTLEAVHELGVKAILSYPNSDAGGLQMIRAIGEYEDQPLIHVEKNLPRSDFINLMRRASCLVGNSSAGILEAPLLKLPVVNIGNRQVGRLHAENVQFVPHEKGKILEALRRAVFDEAYRQSVTTCSNPYGDGQSSARIAQLLATIPIDRELLIKDLTF